MTQRLSLGLPAKSADLWLGAGGIAPVMLTLAAGQYQQGGYHQEQEEKKLFFRNSRLFFAKLYAL